jgi:cation transport regulator ChaC
VLTLVERPGASVAGAVYLVAAPALELLSELDYRERAGYERVQLVVTTATGVIDAVTWIAPPGNEYDVGAMPLEALALHVRDSVGPSGRNDDYVFRLEQALAELGAPDPHITELSALLRR